jgi:glycosyltransferase involved in cell wall biosynthesis
MKSKLPLSATKKTRILIDAREFVPGRLTGISRVLEGLINGLTSSFYVDEMMLAVWKATSVPLKSREHSKITIHELPPSFIKSEISLSQLTNSFDLYISPYPKLPFFGCHCKTIHTVHDILDLTHEAYRRRVKVLFDTYRFKKALKRADLTWYDSAWSLEETQKYTGFAGHDPRIRHPGIEARFNSQESPQTQACLKKYHLNPGYIICIGNGKPHKNLGMLLNISSHLKRKLVFVGVSNQNQPYWKAKYPGADAEWIEYIDDEDLPVVIKQAYCLVQPSTAEGYGYPPLEAMACGVPVIISKMPVLIETTGGQALYASPDRPNEWLDLLEILEDQSILKSQIEKGIKWSLPLQGNKGWEKHLQDIEELLKRA